MLSFRMTIPSGNAGGRPPEYVPCGWCAELFPMGKILKHFPVCPHKPARAHEMGRKQGRRKQWKIDRRIDLLALSDAVRDAHKELQEFNSWWRVKNMYDNLEVRLLPRLTGTERADDATAPAPVGKSPSADG